MNTSHLVSIESMMKAEGGRNDAKKYVEIMRRNFSIVCTTSGDEISRRLIKYDICFVSHVTQIIVQFTFINYRYKTKFDVCLIDDATSCAELNEMIVMQYKVRSMVFFGNHALTMVCIKYPTQNFHTKIDQHSHFS